MFFWPACRLARRLYMNKAVPSNLKMNPSPNLQEQPTKSYAGAANTVSFPSKEQSILLDACENLTVKDYISKLTEIVPPSAITFISRISNNRICVFLNSKTNADFITNKYPTLIIKNTTVNVRPLINKLKRIIISNVYPFIPNEEITNIFKNHDIKTASSISFIRAGLSDPNLSHIMSFRRQTFIQPEELHKLPQSSVIVYEGTPYRIFFSAENITCFNCKMEGHTASNCPQNHHKENCLLDSTSTNISSNPTNHIEVQPITVDSPTASPTSDPINFPPS